MKFEVKKVLSGEVMFTADIKCKADDEAGIKLGLAIKWAIKEKISLYGANLYGANLVRANLVRANLDGANLDGANLYGANLYGARTSMARTSSLAGSAATVTASFLSAPRTAPVLCCALDAVHLPRLRRRVNIGRRPAQERGLAMKVRLSSICWSGWQRSPDGRTLPSRRWFDMTAAADTLARFNIVATLPALDRGPERFVAMSADGSQIAVLHKAAGQWAFRAGPWTFATWQSCAERIVCGDPRAITWSDAQQCLSAGILAMMGGMMQTPQPEQPPAPGIGAGDAPPPVNAAPPVAAPLADHCRIAGCGE